MKISTVPRYVPKPDLASLVDSWVLALNAERKSPKTVKLYREGVQSSATDVRVSVPEQARNSG